jgi:hypothetical protein
MKMTRGSKRGHCWQIHLLSELVLSVTSTCAFIIPPHATATLLYREADMKCVDISVGNCCGYQYYY